MFENGTTCSSHSILNHPIIIFIAKWSSLDRRFSRQLHRTWPRPKDETAPRTLVTTCAHRASRISRKSVVVRRRRARHSSSQINNAINSTLTQVGVRAAYEQVDRATYDVAYDAPPFFHWSPDTLSSSVESRLMWLARNFAQITFPFS